MISRNAAIDLFPNDALEWDTKGGYIAPHLARQMIEELPFAQPEITDEQAIEHLQSTGWMQNHDREIYESGLREQLADDSGSYDSLIPCEGTISRRAAIDALWKALYEYEDKTEKQFQESEDLDVEDWIGHRIFVQNMNDIDRQTILNLPSAQPKYEPVTAEDFAKTMSENTIYSFIAWYGTVLELIEKQGFTICKKTM